jgi:hypothetical protein
MKRILWASWITGWVVALAVVALVVAVYFIFLAQSVHKVGWALVCGVFLAAVAGDYARQRIRSKPTSAPKMKQ